MEKTIQNLEQTQNFLPFPHGSISLLVGPSNVGKSSYVLDLLENSNLFFNKPFKRIFVVNCHSLVSQYKLKNPDITIIHCLLSNFEIEDLEPGDVLVFEDVQEISATIKLAVTTIVHHLQLSGCFIICHSILGSKLFEILQFCHQIILFLTSSAVSRLALYIVRAFFVDEETKNYLKSIISVAENQQTILHLSLNPIAGVRTPYHLALSHLSNLKANQGSFCIIYPLLNKMKYYEDLSADSFALVNEIDSHFLENVPEKLHPHSYLFVNSANVLNWKEQNNSVGKNSKNQNCITRSDEENWLFAVTELENDIEESFPAKKIFKAKSLAREMLKNSDFCLNANGRTMSFINKPNKIFSVLEFLNTAVRMAGPKEMVKINDSNYKLYRTIVKSLLNKDCPIHFIKNKILLANLKQQHGNATKNIKNAIAVYPFDANLKKIKKTKKNILNKPFLEVFDDNSNDDIEENSEIVNYNSEIKVNKQKKKKKKDM